MPTAAPACRKALDELTDLHPGRSQASDGILGDRRHSKIKSDHNKGNAFDATHDPGDGVDCEALSEGLRKRCAAGKETRVTYLIWRRRIASPVQDWAWRSYDGSNPHTKHMHVSIKPQARNRVGSWWSWTQRSARPELRTPFPLPSAHAYGADPGKRVTVHDGAEKADRAAIERIQRVLRLPVDGRYGAQTATAVGNWQARRGIKVTKRVGPDEWRRFGL